MRTQKVPLSEIEQGVSGLCDRVNKADDALKEANQRLAECYRLTGGEAITACVLPRRNSGTVIVKGKPALPGIGWDELMAIARE